MSGLKDELHRKLQDSRVALLSKVDGLSEYDRRRPMTPTGTNLLGLVKHGVEFEEYDTPETRTENGVARMPDGGGAAFNDSEGNLVGVIPA